MDEQTHEERGHDKDPAEQEALARDLAAELADIFAQYVRGELDFAETSFATYDVLQDLHVVATGAYELVEDDEDDEDDETSDDSSDDGDEDDEAGGDEADDDAAEDDADEADGDGEPAEEYSDESAAEQQEELSGEPSR